MQINYNTNRGFTLIELLISIGVLGLISGIMISAFLSLSSSYDKADVMVKVNHEGTRIMEQLVRLVRSAHEARSSGASGLILDIPTDTSNLEYGANGNCTQDEIYLNVAALPTQSSTINKRSSSCSATAVCSATTPCVLTSNDVHVISFSVSVTEYSDQPDIVSFTLELQQNRSLSDPDQKASMKFERVVSTRGYR